MQQHIPRERLCRFCGKTFSCKGNTTRHMRLFHPECLDAEPGTIANGAVNAAVIRSPLRVNQQKSVCRTYSPMDCHSYCGSRGILFNPAVLTRCSNLSAQTSNAAELLRDAANRSISTGPSNAPRNTSCDISPDPRRASLAASQQDTSAALPPTFIADSLMNLPSCPGGNLVRQLDKASMDIGSSSPLDRNMEDWKLVHPKHVIPASTFCLIMLENQMLV